MCEGLNIKYKPYCSILAYSIIGLLILSTIGIIYMVV